MTLAIKLTKTTFKKIEAEWFNYHNTLKEINLLREEIMHPFDEDPEDKTIVKGASSVKKPGDPTESTVTRLTMNKQLNYLNEIVVAIERVYNTLPDTHKKIVQYRYWTKSNKYTWDRIAMEISISERQARRWRNEIVLATAEKLGWR